MRKGLLILIAILQFQSIFGSQNHPYYLFVNLNPYALGMFSVFNYVTGVLDEYESGKYQGIEVNFETNGVYFDPKLGPNWWEYYCEPIKLGFDDGAYIKRFCQREYEHYAFRTELSLTREQVHAIIQKYIKIKPGVLAKVKRFRQKYFKNCSVMGIHYRGTDKSLEAPRVAFVTVASAVRDYIKQHHWLDYQIFVATDEQQFLDYMQRQFPGRIICTEAERSSAGQALHYNTKEPYNQGLEAMIDCLLLSECDALIRTSSNLGLWSGYFNPDLPIVLLNGRN